MSVVCGSNHILDQVDVFHPQIPDYYGYDPNNGLLVMIPSVEISWKTANTALFTQNETLTKPPKLINRISGAELMERYRKLGL